MNRLRKILIILFSYLLLFTCAAGVTVFMMNRGKVSGRLQENVSSLPVMYVRAGGQLINEMHGYLEPVDAGYYRDILTPVGESRTINLTVRKGEGGLSSARYELYDEQNVQLLEQGDVTQEDAADGIHQMQIIFDSMLYSNTEYCLHVILTEESGREISYYSRLHYGDDLKISEKIKFVLDFNEATFDKQRINSVARYLRQTSLDNSDFSVMTMDSSAEAVTWGSLAPARTSDVSICVKEINTYYATIMLTYTIESTADDLTTEYDVWENYRIMTADEGNYMLDFKRYMSEIPDLNALRLTSGQLRLGVAAEGSIDAVTYGTEEQTYVYLCSGARLLLYDVTSGIVTSVYDGRDEKINEWAGCGQSVKVVGSDSESGDLYFVVYGYMHSGNYEGREGVLLYHFVREDARLEALMFLSYDKGLQQLSGGIEKLAYLADDGMIYLMIEDSIYRIDPELFRIETAWDGVADDQIAFSESGILVMTENPAAGSPAGDTLTILDLNTGNERTLDGNGEKILPYGFIGEDLVYGLAKPELIAMDSSGTIRTPVSELRIVDKNLKEVRSYSAGTQFITSTDIRGKTVDVTLSKKAEASGYTDYQESGHDYILRNEAEDEDAICVEQSTDSIRGVQNWLNVQNWANQELILQTARNLNPEYDISKEYTLSGQLPVRYYVFAGGQLDEEFPSLKAAISHAENTFGTVMTSHKQVVWLSDGSAYYWSLPVNSITKVSGKAYDKAVLQTILDYEGWEQAGEAEEGAPLFAVMTAALPTETVNLSGLALEDVVQFIYRDRLVVARTGADTYSIITGYQSDSITMTDLAEGEKLTYSWDEAEELFKKNGNVFYSYY